MLLRKLPQQLLLVAVTCAVLGAQSGFVKSANQQIPGATVTATHGDTRLITVTDQNGHYVFSSLTEGVWTLEVRMFGFEPAKKELNYSAAAKPVDFNLQLLESPMARRIAGIGRAGDQAGNQLESQIQTEVNANQVQQVQNAPTNGNEAFLVSGS